ncbi:MAG: hypothetical protein AAB955_01640 [Patescibacteria group bacterium]
MAEAPKPLWFERTSTHLVVAALAGVGAWTLLEIPEEALEGNLGTGLWNAFGEVGGVGAFVLSMYIIDQAMWYQESAGYARHWRQSEEDKGRRKS